MALTGTDLDIVDVLAGEGVRLVRKPILTAANAAELIGAACDAQAARGVRPQIPS